MPPRRTVGLLIRGATLCILLSACIGDGPGGGSGAVAIPRQRSLPIPDRLHVLGMNYDPSDVPLAFMPSGELLVAHTERYSSHDVYSLTCRGSGFYAVPLTGGLARPLATGDRACLGLGARGAAASGTGTSVVLSEWMEPNNSRLARLDLHTGRVDTLVTACAVYLENPSISPDGRTIAAIGLCSGRDQESYALYTLRADGSDLREVLADAVGQAPAAWSPDGRWLAATRNGRVVVMAPDGGSLRTVTTGGGPAWSPDGRWIAFFDDVRGDRRREGIFMVRPDGSGRRLVFRNALISTYSRGWGPLREGEPESGLVWSPDSRWIAFSRRFDRGTLVWRVHAESGRLEQVTRAAR